MANKNLEIKPVVSEKSYALANAMNKYMFLVPTSMNKIEIGKAVSDKYKVTVEKVNVVTKPGKMRRDWATYRLFRKEDQKKAFVTLKQGDKINEFFEV